jgi:hypothetical protein
LASGDFSSWSFEMRLSASLASSPSGRKGLG